MNRIELKAKIDLFRRELKSLEAITVSCQHCEFYPRTGWCEKHQATPPAEVAAVGCDDWTFDTVPF